MAINFPANPSDGDTYDGFIWVDSKSSWRKLDTETYIVSATEPESPMSGMVWFNTTIGAFLFYYSDIDSSQWIEIGGATGPLGLTGPQGEAGPDGAEGVGVPAGGEAGEVLVKSSNVDYDTSWQTLNSPGLVLLDTNEVSSTTVISFDNVFSSSYNSYYINFDLTSGGDSQLELNFRSGGVADTSTDYHYIMLLQNGGFNTFRSNTISNIRVSYMSGGGYSNGSIRVSHPFESTKYTVTKNETSWTGGTPVINYESTSGVFAANKSFDGFQLTGGNFSGRVSVYGHSIGV